MKTYYIVPFSSHCVIAKINFLRKLFTFLILGNIGKYYYNIHSKGFHTGAPVWYPLMKTKNVTPTHNLIKSAGCTGAEKRQEGSQHEMGEARRFPMVGLQPQKEEL